MDKELRDLLDTYENVIYGKAFPISPSMHQLHLLLDYIANLEQQVKKQKEVIDKAIEYIEKLLKEEIEITDETNIYYGEKLTRPAFSEDEVKQIIDILKEGKNE